MENKARLPKVFMLNVAGITMQFIAMIILGILFYSGDIAPIGYIGMNGAMS